MGEWELLSKLLDSKVRDPLSPFLFLICSEGLSSLIRLAMCEKKISSAKASKNGAQFSYLLFADDCVLFEEATMDDANNLKGF